jgi:hypothetical protein
MTNSSTTRFTDAIAIIERLSDQSMRAQQVAALSSLLNQEQQARKRARERDSDNRLLGRLIVFSDSAARYFGICAIT